MPEQNDPKKRDRLEEDKRNAQIREETNVRNSLATEEAEGSEDRMSREEAVRPRSEFEEGRAEEDEWKNPENLENPEPDEP